MKTINDSIIECVGPRCSMNEFKKMSMSGMTESVRATGMLRFVFNSFAEALLEMYPNAR